ncbi:hypothetical protein RI129_008907 [Pyrocoelia pectoralis]|uniref:ISXO2-like transposase domain-containing protein n=1 Tax=Pyrocoelia pectoralis TaxID=417401 RepID=A0AAN7ZE52_9COLE
MDCITCINFYFSFIGLCTRTDELIAFLQAHQVLPRTIDCPMCKKPCALVQDGFRLRFRCRRTLKEYKKELSKKCNFSVSAMKGTIFDGSRLDITTICHFICHWLHGPYPRQLFLMEQLQISSNTFITWSSFCREVCINYLTRNSMVLGGEGVTVEIDEAMIGRLEGRIDGRWFLGGFERGTNNIFIVPIPIRNAATLLQVVRNRIRPGTTIISDCWRAYDCLNHEGFDQFTVDHGVTFVDPFTGAHTQNIDRLWRDVRGRISRYGRKEGHMVGYLAEFMFKRLVNRTNLIHEFMRAAAILYPPSVPTNGEEDPEESTPGPSNAS